MSEMIENPQENPGKMKKGPNDLTEGPVLSGLLAFTVPFLLSNLLQTLYGTVDTLVIGNYGATSGVSAVACGAQLLSLFTFFGDRSVCGRNSAGQPEHWREE